MDYLKSAYIKLQPLTPVDTVQTVAPALPRGCFTGAHRLKTILTDRRCARSSRHRRASALPCGMPRLSGFGLRVTDRGVISFHVMRRLPGKPHPVRVVLGKYPSLSLAAARKKAGAALDDLASGVHPRERARALRAAEDQRKAVTVAHVVEEFATRHLSRKRTGHVVGQLLRRELVSRWGDRPITDITRADVIGMVEAIGDTSPSAARQAWIYTSRLFGWALNRDVYGLTASPCDRIRIADLIGSPKAARAGAGSRRAARDLAGYRGRRIPVRSVRPAADPAGLPPRRTGRHAARRTRPRRWPLAVIRRADQERAAAHDSAIPAGGRNPRFAAGISRPVCFQHRQRRAADQRLYEVQAAARPSPWGRRFGELDLARSPPNHANASFGAADQRHRRRADDRPQAARHPRRLRPLWLSGRAAVRLSSYGPRACGTLSSRRRRTWFCSARPGIDGRPARPLYDLRYDQLYTRLSQILSALPVIESRRDTVGDVAEYLCSIYWSPPDDFAPTSRNKTNAICWRCGSGSMHSVSTSAKMSETARVAMKIDNGLSTSTGPDGGRTRTSAHPGTVAVACDQPGRPRKRRADKITAAAARGFWWLTGMHPTLRTNSEGVAYGPFLDFLKAVFEACGVTASAEAQFKVFQRKYRPSTW